MKTSRSSPWDKIMAKVFNRAIQLGGETVLINNVAVDVKEYSVAGNYRDIRTLAANVASLASLAGFEVGCKLVTSDTGVCYFNTGTVLSSTFSVVGTVGNGSVTLAKLASGVTPSHVVKYAGKITWSGSGASLATTVTGVLSTDIVVATIQTAPTQAAYLVSAAPTTDTITITLSAANTGNQAVIAYTVFRAAA